MPSFNRVILAGNLTRDPELRHIPSGTSVTDIGLAINDRRKLPTGEWVEDVTFVEITLWGRTAEIVCQFLTKGSPALIEGRLKYEAWEAEGQKRSKLKIVGERVEFIGGGGSGANGASGVGGNNYANASSGLSSTGTASRPPARPQQAPPPQEYYDAPPIDEVPF
ncbi:MAG: single-stranded DNA-binding protein [Planctomycetaceae bacterium]|jgi:single-strand DNA-binding protein|nr:single-stranded DNA-binding protein [Planctomycetaceae bacterium]